MSTRFAHFREFYPFYLREHRNRTCRRLHVIGSTVVLLVALGVLVTQHWLGLIALPIVGYGFAWIGHFFFEHNRPATFRHPFYSLLGDWVLWWQTVSGRIRF